MIIDWKTFSFAEWANANFGQWRTAVFDPVGGGIYRPAIVDLYRGGMVNADVWAAGASILSMFLAGERGKDMFSAGADTKLFKAGEKTQQLGE